MTTYGTCWVCNKAPGCLRTEPWVGVRGQLVPSVLTRVTFEYPLMHRVFLMHHTVQSPECCSPWSCCCGRARQAVCRAVASKSVHVFVMHRLRCAVSDTSMCACVCDLQMFYVIMSSFGPSAVVHSCILWCVSPPLLTCQLCNLFVWDVALALDLASVVRHMGYVDPEPWYCRYTTALPH